MGSSARSSTSSVSCSVGADAVCRTWRTPGVGAVSCWSTGSGGYRVPRVAILSLQWLSKALHMPRLRAWRGAKGKTARRRR